LTVNSLILWPVNIGFWIRHCIFLSYSCKSETLSTLRFAQRAKAIKNNAVVNEEKVEDVNALREQIRQLKV